MPQKINLKKIKPLEMFLTILPWIYVVLGLIFLLAPADRWPKFYTPHFYGAAFLISTGLFLLLRKILGSQAANLKPAAMFLLFTIGLALTLNFLGELYLYQLYLYNFPYDKFIHLINSFLITITLAAFIQARFKLSQFRAVILAAVFILGGGLLWEATEFTSDLLFKTTEFGIYGMYQLSDTVLDITFDILGVAMGLIQRTGGFNKLAREIAGWYCPTSLNAKTAIIKMGKNF